jgi:hypothetical protein
MPFIGAPMMIRSYLSIDFTLEISNNSTSKAFELFQLLP